MTNKSDWVIPGPPLRGILSPPGDVDDVNGVIDEFAAELGGQIVPPALDEQEVGTDVGRQLFESVQIVADVLANRGVRTATGLDGADPLRRQAPGGDARTRRPRA